MTLRPPLMRPGLATTEFAGSPSFDMRISQLTITKPEGLTAAKPPGGRCLANGLVPLEPDGERLVAYLERRTQWDS